MKAFKNLIQFILICLIGLLLILSVHQYLKAHQPGQFQHADQTLAPAPQAEIPEEVDRVEPPAVSLTNLEDYHATAVYVYNRTDQEDLLALNGNLALDPASLTKILTVYQALLMIDDLDAIAPIDPLAYQYAIENNLSQDGFLPYEQTTYRDLLYGTLLASGGETAVTLAAHSAGSVDQFIEEMNKSAQSIGMTNTHFTNVIGTDQEGHVSSAQDIARLMNVALDNDHFRTLFTSANYLSTPTLEHPEGLWIQSTIYEKLVEAGIENSQIIGGKSGLTFAAGICWATLSEKDGKEYLIVLMGIPFQDLDHLNYHMIEDTLKIIDLL